MRKNFLVTILVFFFLFVSCVREEIIDLSSRYQSQLFVIGFLSPDNNVQIYVGRTIPFGSNQINPEDFKIFDAEVEITEEGGDTYLLNPIGNGVPAYGCSKEEFSVSEGKTYLLTVRHHELPNVFAKTTIPLNKAFWKNLELSPDEMYYYVVSGTWEKAENIDIKQYGVRLENLEPYRLNKGTNEGIFPQGNLITVKRDVFIANGENKVRATLLTRDIHYSEFSRTSDLTWDITENFSSAGFAEIISGFKGVIPQHSNIQNGAGVFGSYLSDTRTVE
ncbi:DUF4249 family protein [Sphingobacterium phlebotomi]|uniref:DUF4249 family protein n=1 Tax=Sphingobacterium phlebotomi TaxID=2605433 RepID=A0A5D4H8J6_9SPHI|nr:DUF4249 family protein [Sphingobacterium phlebotomi]TYR37471.1 DUF4249 family protein [Sphingobacterium phlebotomi]